MSASSYRGLALEWVWAKPPDFFGYLGDGINEGVALSTGHVVDTQPSATQSDLVEKLFGKSHSLGGPHVPAHVVAVAERAGYHTNAVGSLLKGLQDIFNVHFARAGQFDKFGPSRVGKTESAGCVSGHIGAVDASKNGDLRIKTIIRHIG
jgi:hypothetical protein